LASFLRLNLTNFLPGLASSYDPDSPDLCLPSSLDYSHVPPCLAKYNILIELYAKAKSKDKPELQNREIQDDMELNDLLI
jgi:hypothetical protein